MVMHARKPQRMSDGYFEKHQTHSYQSSKYSSSKREYDRDASSRSNYRDRETSPTSGGNGGSSSLINGNSTYRSQSPEVDSPSRHDIRDRDRDRDRFSYIQKMRDRDRDVYKKDKYSDKRDRRGGERDSEHRTNHDRLDRRAKLCSSSGDKRSGSDDRDRDRDRDLRDSKRERSDRDRDRDRDRERDRDRDRSDRDRDRDRERNDRGERVARCGDWSEHVSSSGKMYYYNCKTEVSQWEKPKEWIEKERNLARDQHREKDYRDKERDRERDERFARSSAAYTKHSNSRGNSRLRWPYENDDGPPAHRRRLEDNPDMDISAGDSTPTSEASYSHQNAPNSSQLNDPSNNTAGASTSMSGGSGPVLLANALPRLASHPQTSSTSSSQMNYVNSSAGIPGGPSNSNCLRKLDSVVQQTAMPLSSPNQGNLAGVVGSLPSSSTAGTAVGNHLLHHLHSQQKQSTLISNLASSMSDNHHMNSNAPGPPKLGTKSLEQIESQKMMHSLILRQQQQPTHLMGIPGSSDGSGLVDSNHSNSVPNMVNLRDNSLNSPLYNFTHGHGMSPINHVKNSVGPTGSNASGSGSYTCNTPFGLKTVEGVTAIGSVGPITNLTNVSAGGVNCISSGVGVGGEGPPTPTQELDISGNSSDQRKLEGTSASLSNLQSCVTSSAGRAQGPDLSPKLAKYFRADLITHVTNWQADILEKQAQKCSEETHIYGDLQCTKVSAELKCARSLVRITEITATLQEQKIMYLRQQIHRLEQLKSQNSFMSDDL